MSEVEEMCESCNGSGDCSECSGAQTVDGIECEVCNASGLCEECQGDGSIVVEE